ncbi:MAG: helix-turn-helix domain-containing protein [Myxococcaceae bacterium]|nr:helix-turn-helix domain-containing protein [Myxococcaceae bacterium]
MDHVEFGRYLTQQRELRGMSREDISQRTKIPKSVLLALETGQRERLPERVFVLNYIRAYAQAIGLAPEEAVLRYEEIYTGANTLLTPVEQERRRRRKAWTILSLLLLGVAALVGAVVWLNRPVPH